MSKEVLVEISARHIHLAQEDLESLFGAGYQLTKKKDLSQPGQFACEERLTIVGPKGELKNVSILGPVRPATQVEVSLTEARTLGIAAQIRESGDIAGTAGCTLVGPAGEITIAEGVIAAKRHLHVAEDEAEGLAVKDKEIISIKIVTAERSLVFGDVVVRVSPKYATAVHLDTDEANASGFTSGVGEVIK